MGNGGRERLHCGLSHGDASGQPAGSLFCAATGPSLKRVRERFAAAGWTIAYDERTSAAVAHLNPPPPELDGGHYCDYLAWVLPVRQGPEPAEVRLETDIKEAMQIALHEMDVLNLPVSCGPDKTAVLVQPCGEGAEEQRRWAYLAPRVLEVRGVKVPIVATYRHLGNEVQATGTSTAATQKRLQAGRAKLRKLRKFTGLGLPRRGEPASPGALRACGRR